MFNFNPFRKQSQAGTAGDNGTTDKTKPNADEAAMKDQPTKDQATDTPKDAPKADEAKDQPKVDPTESKYWGTKSKIAVGVLGFAAVAGVSYLLASALRASDNAAVAAVGDAVAAGAEAVVDGAGAVVGEAAAAMFSK